MPKISPLRTENDTWSTMFLPVEYGCATVSSSTLSASPPSGTACLGYRFPILRLTISSMTESIVTSARLRVEMCRPSLSTVTRSARRMTSFILCVM